MAIEVAGQLVDKVPGLSGVIVRCPVEFMQAVESWVFPQNVLELPIAYDLCAQPELGIARD